MVENLFIFKSSISIKNLYNLVKDNKIYIREKFQNYINIHNSIEDFNINQEKILFTFYFIYEIILLSLNYMTNPLISNKKNYREDLFSTSGIIQARRYMKKNINPGEFIFLLKYYSQSYIDLITDKEKDHIYLEHCSIINKGFTFIKQAFTMEWLCIKNSIIIEEFDLKCVDTIKKWKELNKLENPVILLNNSNKIKRLNRASETFLKEYGERCDKKLFFSSYILNHIEPELLIFASMDNPVFTFNTKFNIKNKTSYFNIKMIKIPSDTEGYDTAIILYKTIEADIIKKRNISHRTMSLENLVVKIATRFINIDFSRFNSEIEETVKVIRDFVGAECIITVITEDGSGRYEWLSKGFIPMVVRLSHYYLVEKSFKKIYDRGIIHSSYSGQLFYFTGQKNSIVKLLVIIEGIFFIYVSMFFEAEPPQSKPARNVKKFPWLMDMTQKLKTIYIQKMSDFPPEGHIEKEFFEHIKVKSLVSIPLSLNKKALGSIGFFSYFEERIWLKKDLKLLKLLGDIFVNVWKRYEGEKKLKEYQGNLENIIKKRTEELILEIEQRKKAENHLNYWLSMEELITNISTRFINFKLADFDKEIKHSLEAAGKFVDTDRVCLYFFNKNKNHEWCSKNLSHNYTGNSIANFLYEKFKEPEYLEEINISSVMAHEKEWLYYEIKSILMFPIYRENILTGCFGFTMKKRERDWKDEERRFLKMLGEIFIRVYERYETGKKEKNLIETNIERSKCHNIIGKSPSMQKIYSIIEDLSDINSTVLVTGESGTGKELVAEALHYKGVRRHKPLIKVGCPSISENLFESELFGHVKGAFTGAIKDKTGRFQQANSGTIFLDEIGDINPEIQKKLLRVLQEKEFEPVGSSKSVKVDVRLVAATNQDLKKKVLEGNFREDLYYRLEVVEIKLPPLRERKEDIRLLSNHFIKFFSNKLNKKKLSLSEETYNIFMNYSWPGNIRELEHTMEHAVIFSRGSEITPEDLPDKFKFLTEQTCSENKKDDCNENSFNHLKELELEKAKNNIDKINNEIVKIEKALKETEYNITKASIILGMSRPTLYERIKKYNITFLKK